MNFQVSRDAIMSCTDKRYHQKRGRACTAEHIFRTFHVLQILTYFLQPGKDGA